MSVLRATLYAVLLLLLGHARAQQALTATGGDATGSGGTVSYSVGQLDHISIGSAAGVVSQGVQQPYEVLATAVDAPDTDGPRIAVYPNPTVDGVMVRLEDHRTSGDYRLYDADGRLLISDRLNGSGTTIPMARLPRASYTLVIAVADQHPRTFRLIKN